MTNLVVVAVVKSKAPWYRGQRRTQNIWSGGEGGGVAVYIRCKFYGSQNHTHD